MQGYIQSGCKKIYYEALGDVASPAFLYLHGGPGTGSYDFMLSQGKQLSEFIRIIAIDQRGVLRSDALKPEDSFGLLDIITDCEVVRQHFNLQSWGLIGHSFGGYLAAKYKLVHPERISRIIFECPTFDMADSARSLLEGASQIYRKLGNTAEEIQCRKKSEIREPRKIWNEISNTLNQLGSLKDELYVFGQDKHFFNNIVITSGLSQEEWGKASTHQNKLYTEGLIFESLLEQLLDIECPMLLIKGESDWVTSNNQVRHFLKGRSQRSYVIIEKSGHFPRFERSEAYTEEIRGFVSKS